MPGEFATRVDVRTYTTLSVYVDETVLVDRFQQVPGTDYSYGGNTILFTRDLDASEKVYIRGRVALDDVGLSAGIYDYSADALLQEIRDVANAGASTQDWPDDRLLRLINRQVLEYLLPFILRTRKEDFVTFTDQALVQGVNAYRIPSKATAARIRALALVDPQGNAVAKLIELPLENAILAGADSLAGPVPQGTPTGYYFRGNQIVLVPMPAQLNGVSLRVFYPARPSMLALKAGFIQVTSFPGGAAPGFFRVGIGAAVPGGYGANAACDLVQNQPGFDVLFTGAINAIVAGSYVEFAGTMPTGLAAGDWVCVTGTAPVITGAVAEVTRGCLVNKVVLEILGAKSDDAGFKRRRDLLKMSEEEARSVLLAPRNTGDLTKVGANAIHRFKRGAAWGGCA
jgi:hypothetical protein